MPRSLQLCCVFMLLMTGVWGCASGAPGGSEPGAATVNQATGQSTITAAHLPDFTELVNGVGPAVVNISTETLVREGSPGEEMMRRHGQGSGFEEFFEQFERFFTGQGADRVERALGSGFVISHDGYIITNQHVVQGADRVIVTMMRDGGDREYHARVVGVDQPSDLALLKIEATGLPVLALGDSDSAKVGEWVLAVGNPFGLDHTYTVGIVSGKGRIVDQASAVELIQTDASINPGNSGGPLINLKGEVIGINTALVASGQGIGFAIPARAAREALTRLMPGN